MENDEKEHGRRRRQHLRVPVFPEEKDEIEANAKRAGVSVARYLRDVDQGYQIKGVMDYQHVRELVRGTPSPEVAMLEKKSRLDLGRLQGRAGR